MTACDPKEPISLKLLITLNMHIEPRVSLVEMGMLFVAGIAIFQVWKLFEPRRKGRSRSLMDAIVKPAAVITGAVSFVFGAFFGLFASFAAKV